MGEGCHVVVFGCFVPVYSKEMHFRSRGHVLDTRLSIIPSLLPPFELPGRLTLVSVTVTSVEALSLIQPPPSLPSFFSLLLSLVFLSRPRLQICIHFFPLHKHEVHRSLAGGVCGRGADSCLGKSLPNGTGRDGDGTEKNISMIRLVSDHHLPHSLVLKGHSIFSTNISSLPSSTSRLAILPFPSMSLVCRRMMSRPRMATPTATRMAISLGMAPRGHSSRGRRCRLELRLLLLLRL